jgi:hypothetical protein
LALMVVAYKSTPEGILLSCRFDCLTICVSHVFSLFVLCSIFRDRLLARYLPAV